MVGLESVVVRKRWSDPSDHRIRIKIWPRKSDFIRFPYIRLLLVFVDVPFSGWEHRSMNGRGEERARVRSCTGVKNTLCFSTLTRGEHDHIYHEKKDACALISPRAWCTSNRDEARRLASSRRRMRVPWNASTGNKRSDLLAKLRVFQQQWIFAAFELLLLLLLLLMVVVLMGMLVLVLFLWVWLRALVEYTDRPVLADSVRYFRRVNPHSQLAREQTVQHRWKQSDIRTCLCDHWVHFTVDAYATVTGTAVRTIRKPVVPVTVAEHFCQRWLEHLELSLGQLTRLQTQQMHQKIRRWHNFQSHCC